MGPLGATFGAFWPRYFDDSASIATSCSFRCRTSCASLWYFRSMLLVCRPDPTNTPMQNNAPAMTKRAVSIIPRTALLRHDSQVRCHDYLVLEPEGRLCSVLGSAGLQMVVGCS